MTQETSKVFKISQNPRGESFVEQVYPIPASNEECQERYDNLEIIKNPNKRVEVWFYRDRSTKQERTLAYASGVLIGQIGDWSIVDDYPRLSGSIEGLTDQSDLNIVIQRGIIETSN